MFNDQIEMLPPLFSLFYFFEIVEQGSGRFQNNICM